MSKPWINYEGEEGIPDEEASDGVFGDIALLPGDFGVGEISDDGGNGGGNKGGKPEKIVVFDDEVGEN